MSVMKDYTAIFVNKDEWATELISSNRVTNQDNTMAWP